MAKVRDEINNYADEDDKPILLWLLTKYHWQSQWQFVAVSTLVRDEKLRIAYNRIWKPTIEGRILYNNRTEFELT
jgi:hypothetical protein